MWGKMMIISSAFLTNWNFFYHILTFLLLLQLSFNKIPSQAFDRLTLCASVDLFSLEIGDPRFLFHHWEQKQNSMKNMQHRHLHWKSVMFSLNLEGIIKFDDFKTQVQTCALDFPPRQSTHLAWNKSVTTGNVHSNCRVNIIMRFF